MPVNITIDQLAHSVFKKPVEKCSVDELQQLAHRYPYFGPAQLLLAKKLQVENSSSYEEQVQKASLYFPNRVWLDHLLNDEPATDVPANHSPIIEQKPVIEEGRQNQSEPLSQPVVNEPLEIIQDKPEPIVEPVVNEYKEIAAPKEIIESSEASAEHMPEANEMPAEEEKAETIPALPAFKIEPLAPGASLTFEPYHTVDYFASQGIKAKEEEKPVDKFSQQLKSFTEWLKSMKRLPVTELPVVPDTARESKVEQMAEHSIAERHVITEAMAEVWIKQGNKAKAEEIYRKLSLLDPPKSSYFAAKIEELKQTS